MMKKFEKFLFFYSIIAITIFFISFGVFSPQPLNFIAGILLLPLIFYFWLRMTGPENLPPGKWSIRFLVVIVLLALLGIFGFYLGSRVLPQINALNTKVEEAVGQSQKSAADLAKANSVIATMKQQSQIPVANVKGIDTTSDSSIADLITATSTPSANPNQRITAKPGIYTIDVYQNPDATSTKIGSALGNVNYPFITKQGSWYKIVLSGTATGWVSSTQVREIN